MLLWIRYLTYLVNIGVWLLSGLYLLVDCLVLSIRPRKQSFRIILGYPPYLVELLCLFSLGHFFKLLSFLYAPLRFADQTILFAYFQKTISASYSQQIQNRLLFIFTSYSLHSDMLAGYPLYQFFSWFPQQVICFNIISGQIQPYMVLPIYKVISLVIRVTSRPLVNYTKQIHLNSDGVSHPIMRKIFISLGNSYNRWQTFINRKFMKIQSQFAYKPLNDELAIEKGIQFFYQIMFYSLVIGLPLYQMYRAGVESKQKSKDLEERLKNIEEKLEQVNKAKQPKQKEAELQIEQKRAITNTPLFSSKPITLVFVDGTKKRYFV